MGQVRPNKKVDIRVADEENEGRVPTPFYKPAGYVRVEAEDEKISRIFRNKPHYRFMMEMFVKAVGFDKNWIYDEETHSRSFPLSLKEGRSEERPFMHELKGLKYSSISATVSNIMSGAKCCVVDRTIWAKRNAHYSRIDVEDPTIHGAVLQLEEKDRKPDIFSIKITKEEAIDLQLTASSFRIVNQVVDGDKPLEDAVVERVLNILPANVCGMIPPMRDSDWDILDNYDLLPSEKRVAGILTEPIAYFKVSNGLVKAEGGINYWPWEHANGFWLKGSLSARCPVPTGNKSYLLGVCQSPVLERRKFKVPSSYEILRSFPLTQISKTSLAGMFQECTHYDGDRVEWFQVVPKMLRILGARSLYGSWPHDIIPWMDVKGFKMVGTTSKSGNDPKLGMVLSTRDSLSVFDGCDGWAWNPQLNTMEKLTDAEGLIIPLETVVKTGDLVKRWVDRYPNDSKFFFGVTLGSLPCVFVGRERIGVDRHKAQPEVWVPKGSCPAYAARLASSLFYLAVRNYQMAVNGDWQLTMMWPDKKCLREIHTVEEGGYGFNEYKYISFSPSSYSAGFDEAAGVVSDLMSIPEDFKTPVAPPKPPVVSVLVQDKPLLSEPSSKVVITEKVNSFPDNPRIPVGNYKRGNVLMKEGDETVINSKLAEVMVDVHASLARFGSPPPSPGIQQAPVSSPCYTPSALPLPDVEFTEPTDDEVASSLMSQID